MGTDRRSESGLRGPELEDPKEAEEDARPLNALCKRLSEDGIARKVGASPRGGPPGTALLQTPEDQRAWARTHTHVQAHRDAPFAHAHVYTRVLTGTDTCVL